MLAGRITGPGRIELVDIAEPELTEPDQIIFQPELTCLCGSDLPYFCGPQESYPLPDGLSLHEMLGTVTGTSGERFQPGDRVLAVPVGQVGLFERFAVSETRAIPLDPRKPPEALLLAQPLGTVIYGLKKLPRILDQDVVIVGQGPIGLMFTACMRNLGARRIITVDYVSERRERSRAMGATAVVDPSAADCAVEVGKLTGGALADIVVEAVGHENQVLNLCAGLCRRDGRILYFGVPPEKIDGILWRELFFKNITVHTTVNPDFDRDFPLAMQWICEDRIDLTSLVTHRYPLAEIQSAFELFRDRTDGAIKVLVDFPSRERG